MYYTTEIEGKKGEKFELSTSSLPDGECNVFIGWFIETYGLTGIEYVLINDSQSFTYEITGDETGCIYAVWTTGENPFITKYVDIRVLNGFVMYGGGEGDFGNLIDNAYSAISLSTDGRVYFYDDPTDEIDYSLWDIAFKYELEGDIIHEIREAYQDEYEFYPAEYWVNNPEYSYPDGEINVVGVEDTNGGLES